MKRDNPPASEHQTGLEIAVIGMNGRFPGAPDIQRFWENLKNGEESIIFFSDEELKQSGIAEEFLKAPNYVKAKGYLEGIEYFDAPFFGIKPFEAEKTGPQMRVFYQCVWQALEDAGYVPGSYKGSIGLYAGASSDFSWQTLVSLSGETGGVTDTFASIQLIDKNYLATGLSYKLNLKGPSITLSTACSTSLVAIHLACQALISGECDIALAGGVSVSLPAKNGYLYQEGLIYSDDGYCRAFDRDASGTVFGNGAGVVVLKTLEDALAHRDTIHAVIKGSAINNDGSRKVGFTAPSTKGQAETIRAAYNVAEVDPETVSYIEAHGTGTSLGDPIEIEALTMAFGSKKRQFCAVGSVKSNIGHLDAAAGVAGLIKTVLMMKHRQIPPSIHVETPNPKIEFRNTPFYVNTRLTGWQKGNSPLRAGVSSFGVGGTNAHVVLEEAPGIEKGEKGEIGGEIGDRQEKPVSRLILLSAKSKPALEHMTANLAAWFKEKPETGLEDAAYTLQVGRDAFPFRSMAVCDSLPDALEALSNTDAGGIQSYHSMRGDPPLVFMFSGQGSQYVKMGRELYESLPLFKKEMDRCFDILQSLAEHDIKSILYPAANTNPGTFTVDQTEIAQPLLFILEYALAKLLLAWGFTPHTMIGHSIGEYTAAAVSGVLSPEDALALVVWRGRLMQQMQAGDMLSVKLPEEQLLGRLRSHEDVELAAVNGPSLCVVSGPAEAVETFAAELEQQGVQCRKLHTSHAFHSRSMEPMLEEFEQKVAAVTLAEPKIPYISNVTGKPVNVEEVAHPGYWTRHVRRTVRFGDGLDLLLNEHPDTLFIEVGPGRALSTFVQQHPGKQPEHKFVNLLRHPQETESDTAFLLNKVGQLWIYGKNPDWQRFNETGGRRIPLPTYPFEKRRYWKYVDQLTKGSVENRFLTPRKIEAVTDWYYRPLWRQKELTPFTAEETESCLWLIFTDEASAGLADRVAEGLEKKGHTVIYVTPGTVFERKEEYRCTVNPGEAADFKALFEETARGPGKLSDILYMWSITGSTATDRSSGEDVYDPFYRLLFTLRAIGEENLDHSLHVRVVSEGIFDITGHEELQPSKAMLLGPLKVGPQEYPNLACTCIDVHMPPADSWQEQVLVTQLIAEVTAPPPGDGGRRDTLVALRSGNRWVRDFEPLKLERLEVEGNRKTLRKGGVWLITGGLGGIGMAMAKHLALTIQATVILTGRSAFPPQDQWQEWLDRHPEADKTSRRIRQLQQLKNAGANVLVFKADVANPAEMQQVVQEAEKQVGPVTSVIHAAGLVDENAIMLMPQIGKQAHLQFKPKVEGLAVLEQVLAGKELDTCLLTSSLSSVLGGLGYAAYAAANIYMDAFTARHNRSGSQQWLTVNLDAWRAGPGTTPAMTPDQGVETLQRLLELGESKQVIVSIEELQPRIDRWIKLVKDEAEKRESTAPGTEPADAADARSRPQLPTPYVEPRDQMEEQLAGILQEFFGFNKVGIHDNFFALGASSLDLVQLSGKLKKAAGRDIPVVTLFRYPMISTLAAHLGENDKEQQAVKQQKEQKRVNEMQKGRRAMQSRLELIKKR
jgi:acyl transferase domain-containing protein